ncbi:MAG TPA: class D beta-lactamase [Anaerolineales bacterium]|nr:class D beta-lactamase [Anaerolineales bacterium]
MNTQIRFWISLILAGTLLAGCAKASFTPTSQPTITPGVELKPELESYFRGFTGAFVLYNRNDKQYLRYNPDRCAERFLPASTYKIINSLIGLETGVIPDENYVIEWDGTAYDTPAWNQDHSLKTAIQNSVVWYYQELARRVGIEKEQYYIDLMGYGNQDISGPADLFWLAGGLRISADEQIELLQRLYQDELPFSERSMSIVKEILLLETTDAYQLSGKTGSGEVDGVSISWFIGYVEKNDNVYFFAMNIGSAGEKTTGVEAKQIALDILQGLGLLP